MGINIARPIPGWKPSAPPITGAEAPAVLAQHRVVVVHFWAVWNGHDPVADRELQPLREEFADRVYFCSCDVDHEPSWPFIRECGVLNVPTLACFVDEERVVCSPRYRYPDHLREVILQGLTQTTSNDDG